MVCCDHGQPVQIDRNNRVRVSSHRTLFLTQTVPNMAIDSTQVFQALSHVIDPDLGRDLVTLNMIRGGCRQRESCGVHGGSDDSSVPTQRTDSCRL